MRKEKKNNLLKLKKWVDERGVIGGNNGKQSGVVDGKNNLHGDKGVDKKKERS
jgi:hypothetical protein